MNNIRLRLTPALECYLVALIYRNTRTSCCSLAVLCARMSHDTLRRLLHAKLSWSRRLWFGFARQMVSSGGYLVIDDTTWQRYAEHAEAVSWVWSSTAGKAVRGMQVVLLIWTDGQRKVPIGMRLWRTGGRSKVELAGEMVDEAARRKLTPKYVLFDSWYRAAALINRLDELGWKYVARLKANRLLDGVAVRRTWRTRFGHSIGNLRKVHHEVMVVKDGRRFFVTNDVELTSAEVTAAYRFRQQIEEVFRVLKQEFGWGGASTRAVAAQAAHLHLGLFALCLVQRAAFDCGQTVYAFKHDLFREPIPQHLSLLDNFRAAA
jgi:hypothetical protein